jgi:hypothetical protein
MANKKMNPNNLPWFPTYTAAWLGSDTVQGMTYTERGIYHELMVMCWQYGSIPWDKKTLAKRLRIDQRVCGRFMENYTDLTQTLHEGSTDVTLPKLQEFAETLGKSDPPKIQRRGEEMNGEDTTKNVRVAPVSTTKTTPVPAPVEAPVKPKGFDPLTYSEPVSSTGKGEGMDYQPSDVRRTLLYHFKHHPSDFWQERVTSSATLARYINTMYEQMVRDAGEDWTPPEAKQSKQLTRMAGDPDCKKCRGRGLVGVLNEDGLSRHTEDCPACEKREQVLNRATKEWENVEPNA